MTMANTTVKNSQKKSSFAQPVEDKTYSTYSEGASVEEKMKILRELGQPDLIEIFKGFQPRQARRKRTGAPLDQRVSITVTNSEKIYLDNELKSTRNAGEKISASQFIRNRAIGSIDINGWAQIARDALAELEDIATASGDLKARRRQLTILLDESDDEEDTGLYDMEMSEINRKMGKLVAKNEKRTSRLTGRMSMRESEVVKWRAARLCISSSDYLRMLIFGLEPNSNADAHLSLDAKRRFYVSIIDVANTGWGNPPNIYECSQCANYIEEIDKLRDRVKQLEAFI